MWLSLAEGCHDSWRLSDSYSIVRMEKRERVGGGQSKKQNRSELEVPEPGIRTC